MNKVETLQQKREVIDGTKYELKKKLRE